MDDRILAQQAEELITQFYGEGNPVSEEEIAGLVRGLQYQRHHYARALAKAVALSGLTIEQLTKELTTDFGDDGPSVSLINPNSPALAAEYLSDLSWACEQLKKKGYGNRLPPILGEPLIKDDLSGEFISIVAAIRNNRRLIYALSFLNEVKGTP